jgi:hypothetical protein
LLGAAGGTAEAGKLEAAGLAGAVGCDGCVWSATGSADRWHPTAKTINNIDEKQTR